MSEQCRYRIPVQPPEAPRVQPDIAPPVAFTRSSIQLCRDTNSPYIRYVDQARRLQTLPEAIEVNRQSKYEVDKGLLEAAAEALKASPGLDLQIWLPIQQFVDTVFRLFSSLLYDTYKAGLPLWARRLVHDPLLDLLISQRRF